MTKVDDNINMDGVFYLFPLLLKYLLQVFPLTKDVVTGTIQYNSRVNECS